CVCPSFAGLLHPRAVVGWVTEAPPPALIPLRFFSKGRVFPLLETQKLSADFQNDLAAIPVRARVAMGGGAMTAIRDEEPPRPASSGSFSVLKIRREYPLREIGFGAGLSEVFAAPRFGRIPTVIQRTRDLQLLDQILAELPPARIGSSTSTKCETPTSD